MKKVNYLNNRELLIEIHKSKMSWCSYIEDKYASYDSIVDNLDDINDELIESIRLKKSTPRGKPAIPLEDIPVDSIVIRVMTYEHIPTDENARKSKIHDVPYSRVPFHPFKHYILQDGELKEVCRSHWQGSISNGHFCITHGKITNKLATMYMMLCEKFSYKGNWRSYCLDSETEALTQRGWLNHEQISEWDKVLSYNDGKLVWSEINSIYRNNDYDGKMFKFTGNGIDALVTPNHKFLTTSGPKIVDDLTRDDTLILMGSALDQDSKNDELFLQNELSIEMILGLSNSQREFLIYKILSDIDLFNKHMHDKNYIDMFGILCTLSGYRTHTIDNVVTLFPKDQQTIKVSDINFNSENIEPTIDYKGTVWCLSTECGNFMVKRNGSIYLTNNSYVDEMRGYALEHLCKSGLMFNEFKSDNPFSFFTTLVNNCFKRIANDEKKKSTYKRRSYHYERICAIFNPSI